MKRRNVREHICRQTNERLHNKAYNRTVSRMCPIMRSHIRMAMWYGTDVVVDDNVLLSIVRNLSQKDPVQ